MSSGCNRDTGRENSANSGTLQNCAMSSSKLAYSSSVMIGTNSFMFGCEPLLRLMTGADDFFGSGLAVALFLGDAFRMGGERVFFFFLDDDEVEALVVAVVSQS